MNMRQTPLALATLSLWLWFAPPTVMAQTYECITTTETTTRTAWYSDGTVITTTIVVRSRVCYPI